MDMRNPLLSGENVYAGQPDIFGNPYSIQPQMPTGIVPGGAGIPQGVNEPTVGPPLGPNAPSPSPSPAPTFPTYPGPTSAVPSPVPVGGTSGKTLAEILAGGYGVPLESGPIGPAWMSDWERGNDAYWNSKMREG